MECCGFSGPQEFAYSTLPIDDSCYEPHSEDNSTDDRSAYARSDWDETTFTTPHMRLKQVLHSTHFHILIIMRPIFSLTLGVSSSWAAVNLYSMHMLRYFCADLVLPQLWATSSFFRVLTVEVPVPNEWVVQGTFFLPSPIKDVHLKVAINTSQMTDGGAAKVRRIC